MVLPFLTGNPFSNTKYTKVTKENTCKMSAFSLFVYLVYFVVRLFPVNYGRADFIFGGYAYLSIRPNISTVSDS
jgi:hypothetical protein